MPEICQKELPIKPWMHAHLRRLPGLNPIAPGQWLQIDDAYDAQMALRDALLRERRDAVFRQADGAEAAAAELLERILAELRHKSGFTIDAHAVTRPDGRRVPIDHENPLICAARLVQEDLLILQKPDHAHVLTAAVLCFPARWKLAAKFGASVAHIHDPVTPYDDEMALRVQRMLDFIHPDRPMWRANFLLHDNPELFQPEGENTSDPWQPDIPCWVRVERQSLLRLAESGAVVFSIHTCVVPLSSLGDTERDALLAQKRLMPG